MPATPLSSPWHLPSFLSPPATFPANFPPPAAAPHLRSLFYEGPSWKNNPTRIFAWLGLPQGADPSKKLPAIILIHGGGGTAFPEWVQLWNARGYAALAMDTCGCVTGGEHANRPRHPLGGPPGWGGFDQTDAPPHDQWMYHAVASVLLANSLLRSLPQIDPQRIGLTGISWGGIITAIAASLDDRLRCAAPIYGCGFLGDSEYLLGKAIAFNVQQTHRWLQLWDPAHYLPHAQLPLLWVNGTNDPAFSLPIFQRSYRLPPDARAPRTLSIKPEMFHSQEAGAAPEEIHAFADHHLQNAPPLPRIIAQGRAGDVAFATFSPAAAILHAHLHYTRDSGEWRFRKWHTLPAQLALPAGQVHAPIPTGATAYYLNLTTPENLIISTEHEELSPTGKK